MCAGTHGQGKPLGREIRYMSPDSPVLMIEPLRVDTVELTHPPREIGVGCLDEEVIVVCHKAIGMTDPVVPCKQHQYRHEPLGQSL